MRERFFYSLHFMWKDFKARPVASTASTVALALCLVMIGVLGILIRSSHQVIPAYANESVVLAYLAPEIPAQELDELVSSVKQWPDVADVTVVSKDEALKRLESQLGEWKALLTGFQGNPLPPILEITLRSRVKNSRGMAPALERIEQHPRVEEVFYRKDWLNTLQSNLKYVESAGTWLTGFFALAAVLIVSNWIILAISTRRQEVELLQIVGASPLFVRSPFYFEGLCHGALSACLASGVLVFTLKATHDVIPLSIAATLPWKSSDTFLMTAGLLGCGIIVGWVGSWVALMRIPRI
jgi:cell division transport system permease protein